MNYKKETISTNYINKNKFVINKCKLGDKTIFEFKKYRKFLWFYMNVQSINVTNGKWGFEHYFKTNEFVEDMINANK